MASPGLDCSPAESLLCCEEDVSASPSGYGEPESGRSPFLCYGLELVADPTTMQESDLQAAVSALLEREIFHSPCFDYLEKYETKLLDAGSRQKAVMWLCKVRAFFNFGRVTAALAVNYLDRFLSLHQLPMGKAWMIQLLSVACLSLAAKMEEVDVPVLLDLQVAPEYLFEPRIIQRMELLVLSTLDWRVSSVTPFSYVDYFLCKCSLSGKPPRHIVVRIIELISCAIQDLRFLRYASSSIAAAAFLCSAEELLPLRFEEWKRAIFPMLPSHLQDSSANCLDVMVETFNVPPNIALLKAEPCIDSVPLSPAAVLDASFSSGDSESTFRSVGFNPSLPMSPLAPKKRKLNEFCSKVPCHSELLANNRYETMA